MNNKDIESLVRQQLVTSEINKLKNKIRPMIQEELQKLISTKKFRKDLSECVRSQFSENINEYALDYIDRKTFKKLCERAVRSIIK